MTHRWYLGEGDGGDDGFISQRRKRKMKDGKGRDTVAREQWRGEGGEKKEKRDSTAD